MQLFDTNTQEQLTREKQNKTVSLKICDMCSSMVEMLNHRTSKGSVCNKCYLKLLDKGD